MFVALSTVAALSLVPAPASATPDDRFLKVFVPHNESSEGPRDRAEAIRDAGLYDIISAQPRAYQDHIAAMRQVNPDIQVLAYLNATFAQKGEEFAYPESWYARDAYGRKVRSLGYGNFLMNPLNASWIQNRVTFCNNLMQSSGYHGCMADMLGTAPTLPNYVTSPPIDPRTGNRWTAQDWQLATTALAKTVDAGTGGALWGNGFGSAARYFGVGGGGTSKILATGVHGALSEIWIRTASQSVNYYPDETRWRYALDQLVDLSRNGEATAALVKVWSSGTIAQKDAWHRFALATFLLGSDGKSSFHISYAHGQVLMDHRYWQADIGAPTASYNITNGIYQRPFTRGKVLVNPTAVSRTINLGGTYTDLEGVRRTSITLPPHSGQVMTTAY